MGNPDLSVIICAYNRREFLLDAIKSALNQTLSKDKFEIIVIKNFNDTVIDKFMEENNIKSIIMDGSMGEFLYAGIKNSRGNIISFLDDDDLFFGSKLEYVLNLFEKNEGLVYYHNLAKYIDANGKIIDRENKSIYFFLSCISIKKSIIDERILNSPNIIAIPDYIMYYFALESKGLIIGDNEFLTYYRYHSSGSHNLGNLQERMNHRMKNFEEVKKTLEFLYNRFKCEKVRKHIYNNLLGVKIDLNALYRINKPDKKCQISSLEIVKFLTIFNYWDSFKYYPIKCIKILQMYLPYSIAKKIEEYQISR